MVRGRVGNNTHLLKKNDHVEYNPWGQPCWDSSLTEETPQKMMSDRCTDTDPSSMHTAGLVKVTFLTP